MSSLPNLQSIQQTPITVEEAQNLPEINIAQQALKKLGSRGASGVSIAVFLDKDDRVMHLVEAKDGYYKRRMM